MFKLSGLIEISIALFGLSSQATELTPLAPIICAKFVRPSVNLRILSDSERPLVTNSLSLVSTSLQRRLGQGITPLPPKRSYAFDSHWLKETQSQPSLLQAWQQIEEAKVIVSAPRSPGEVQFVAEINGREAILKYLSQQDFRSLEEEMHRFLEEHSSEYSVRLEDLIIAGPQSEIRKRFLLSLGHSVFAPGNLAGGGAMFHILLQEFQAQNLSPVFALPLLGLMVANLSFARSSFAEMDRPEWYRFRSLVPGPYGRRHRIAMANLQEDLRPTRFMNGLFHLTETLRNLPDVVNPTSSWQFFSHHQPVSTRFAQFLKRIYDTDSHELNYFEIADELQMLADQGLTQAEEEVSLRYFFETSLTGEPTLFIIQTIGKPKRFLMTPPKQAEQTELEPSYDLVPIPVR